MAKSRDSSPFDAAARPAARAVPGQVVVRLTPAARRDPERLQEILNGVAPRCTIKSNVDRFGMVLLQVESGTDCTTLLARLREDDAIEFAEPNFIESGS